MAAADRFRVYISGRGGHAAMPHLTADPVVAGAQIVTALQPLVSRETSPTDSMVVTVSRFNTGAVAPPLSMSLFGRSQRQGIGLILPQLGRV